MGSSWSEKLREYPVGLSYKMRSTHKRPVPSNVHRKITKAKPSTDQSKPSSQHDAESKQTLETGLIGKDPAPPKISGTKETPGPSKGINAKSCNNLPKPSSKQNSSTYQTNSRSAVSCSGMRSRGSQLSHTTPLSEETATPSRRSGIVEIQASSKNETEKVNAMDPSKSFSQSELLTDHIRLSGSTTVRSDKTRVKSFAGPWKTSKPSIGQPKTSKVSSMGRPKTTSPPPAPTYHITWGDPNDLQPIGYNCSLCEGDLRDAPDGKSRPQIAPQAAVLHCGHIFHYDCLKLTTAEESIDPSCIFCISAT